MRRVANGVGGGIVRPLMRDPVVLALVTFFIAFLNDAFGGGYGTLLAPLLLIFGYPAKVVVPGILFSESFSEGLSSGFHAFKYKNTNFRSFGLITLGGVLGIIAAVFVVGVFLTSTAAKLYIGIMAAVMGIGVVVKSWGVLAARMKERPQTNVPLTVLLGIVCGFNKSSTGGGYGPLSTSGFQMLGLPPAKAVGTTIPAKGLACIISIILWSGLVGIDWSVAVPMAVGGIVGAPLAAWLNNYLKLKMSAPFHGRLIGAIMTLLGVYSVLKTLGWV
jgi:uncharacterized protein